jgi:hypothetical protein
MVPHIPPHHLLHFFVFLLVVYAVSVVLWTIPLLQLARKAGLHYAICLLTLLGPLGVMIAVYVLAFAEWKTPHA